MEPAIIDIPGIGPATAEILAEHRIRGLADFAGASVEKIASIPGFSEARATRGILMQRYALRHDSVSLTMELNVRSRYLIAVRSACTRRWVT